MTDAAAGLAWFDLTADQRALLGPLRDLLRDEVAPGAAERDESGEFPHELVSRLGELGLFGLQVPERLGGSGLDTQTAALVIEEVAAFDGSLALTVASHNSLCLGHLMTTASEEQEQQWIPPLARAERLGAWCLTEPTAGSDAASLRTRARAEDNGYVVDGSKVFITNGGIADVTVVVAAVDPTLGTRGQASFIVPGGTPGLSQGKKEAKLGIRASHTAELILEDVRLPSEYLLGGEEKLERKLDRARRGERSRSADALATFELTRPMVGASAIGIAQAAYEWTLEYLEGRTENGAVLIEEQRVQQVLADVATEIEAARLLVQRAAWMGRNGRPMTGGQGSMSKLKAGDVTMWATTQLMDLVGPYAQSRDCPLEKFFRDAKIYQLFEGTAEIQRLVISRMQRREYQQRFAAEGEAGTEPALQKVV